MSFEKDALLHEIKNQVDNFYKDNIVIPIYWTEKNGKKVYDLEYMQYEFDNHMEKLWNNNSKENCEPNNWEDYQCGNDEAPRKEEGEF